MKSLRISKRIIKPPSYLDQFHLDGNKEAKSSIRETKNIEKKDSSAFEKKSKISLHQENQDKNKESKIAQKKRMSSDYSESIKSHENKNECYWKISKRIIKMWRKGIDANHFSISEAEFNNLSKDLQFIEKSSITYEDIK